MASGMVDLLMILSLWANGKWRDCTWRKTKRRREKPVYHPMDSRNPRIACRRTIDLALPNKRPLPACRRNPVGTQASCRDGRPDGTE